jgi:lactate permease
VAGFSFAVMQFVTSNYISPELTDIVATLCSAAALFAFMRIWQPREPVQATQEQPVKGRPAIAGASTYDPALERRKAADEGRPLSRVDQVLAFAPYIIIIIVLGICSLHPVAKELDKATSAFKWPGLHVVNA